MSDTLVCMLFGGVVSTSTVAIPAGMSSILTVNGGVSQPLFGAASLALAGVGATGTKAWTLGTAETTLGVSFLIQQGPVWGFDERAVGDVQPAQPRPRQRWSGAKGKSEFAYFNNPVQGADIFNFPPTKQPRFNVGASFASGLVLAIEIPSELGPFLNVGGLIQPPQPPHPVPERRAAGTMRGDDGTQGTLVRFVDYGHPVQPPQPPHPRREKAAGIKFRSEFAYSSFLPYGWEVTPPQPPHPRPERAGAWMHGDDGGIQFTLVNWTFHGWPPVLFWPPHPRRERSGAIARGDDGNEGTFSVWFNGGWQVEAAQQRRKPPSDVPRAPESIVVPPPAVVFVNWGMVSVLPELPQTPTVHQRGAGAKGRSEFAIFPFPFAEGWDVQPPTGKRPRFAAPLVAPEHVQPTVVTAATVTYAFERPDFWKRTPYNRYEGICGQSDFASFTFTPLGWEVQPHQPGHPRPERGAGWMRGDDPLSLISFVTIPFGWWGEPGPQPPHPRPEKRWASLARGDDGNEGPLLPWTFIGWPVQMPQPPHPRPERWASQAHGNDGTDAPFVNWSFLGWPVQPPQPPRNPWERRGAWMRDDGTEAPFTLWVSEGWRPTASQERGRRPGVIPLGPSVDAPFAPPPPSMAWQFDFFRRLPRRVAEASDQPESFPATVPPIVPLPWGLDATLPAPRLIAARAAALWTPGLVVPTIKVAFQLGIVLRSPLPRVRSLASGLPRMRALSSTKVR